jgi:RimJ/RimL family protein N-acetyltransferase
MLFETKRLYVQHWEEKDLAELYNLFNDQAILDSVLPHLTMGETKQIFDLQLDAYNNEFPFGRYFIKEKNTDDFIGLLLLKKIDEDGIEIGYSFIKSQWQKGFATEVVTNGLQWLCSLNCFSKIYAVTEILNTQSKRVLFKCGFHQEENIVEMDEELNLFSLDLVIAD